MTDKITLNDNRQHLKNVLDRLDFGHWLIVKVGRSYYARRPQRRRVQKTR